MRWLRGIKRGLNLRDNCVISAILMIGFGIRLIGINVGLPDSPDPRETIIAQDVLNLIHFTAVPQTYNWPGTAWFYLIALIGKLLSFGGLDLTEARVILLARCVNVLLSTATLWLTYCIGGRCYNRRVGQIAAGFLAVAMLHATNESRFALVDVPATFCVTLFLYVIVRSRVSSDTLPSQRAIALGVIAGLALAVKFTTVFVGFSLLCFIGSDRFYRRLAAVIGIAALTFTLLCPYWLIDLVSPEWNLFFQDFWYEATHYHRGHFGLIATAEAGWLQRFIYIPTLLKWGMGLPLALLVGFGLLRGLLSLRGGIILETAMLAVVVPYLLFIGAHKVKFARHLLLLYPTLTLLSAAALMRLPRALEALFRFVHQRAIGNSKNPTRIVEQDLHKITKLYLRLRGRCGFLTAPIRNCVSLIEYRPLGKWMSVLVGSGVLLYTSVYTAAFAFVLTVPPTRMAAAEWIAEHIPPEEAISRAPEVLFDWLLPDVDLQIEDGNAKWALILMPNLEVFQKYREHPENYREGDWYPLNDLDSEETLAFYARILDAGSPYRLHKTFQRTPQFLGIQISDTGAPFPMRALTHPELRLYRRCD